MDLKKKFEEDGYIIFDTRMSSKVFDRIINNLAHHFGPNREIPIHVPHSDHARIQDAWHINQDVLEVALAPRVLEILQHIYGKTPQPFQTLNFYKGSQQPVHADTIHFNCEPFGAMCGVWVALEDISLDQGPLIYYPGSHKLPEMNYDYFNLEPKKDSYQMYLSEIQKLIKLNDFSREYGILSKGQCLVWSANLLHGGAIQTKRELSRHSQVTHYFMGEPKAWRPIQSSENRHYFKPEKVEDVSNKPYRYPISPRPPTLSERLADKVKRTIRGKKS